MASDVLSIINYAIHIAVFYLWLIPSISERIHKKCVGYWGCKRFLKQTYLGYTVDLADSQWRELRQSMWLLWLIMILISLAHFIFRFNTTFYKSTKASKNRGSDVRRSQSDRYNNSGSGNYDKNLPSNYTAVPPSSYFRLIVGLGFIILLHGNHALVVLVIAYVGFRIAKWQGKRASTCTLITWIYALSVLMFKESYRLQNRKGFNFLRPIFDRSIGGMYGWQLPANFLILRIVSFILDYHWACMYHHKRRRLEKEERKNSSSNSSNPSIHSHNTTYSAKMSPINHSETPTMERSESVSGKNSERSSRVDLLDDEIYAYMTPPNHHLHGMSGDPGSSSSSPRSPTALQRRGISSAGANEDSAKQPGGPMFPTGHDINYHRRPEEYNFINFISYILYPPLYMAGPIMSFNDFVENTNNPQKSESPWTYGIRWLLCFGLMEFLTCKFPFFAIIQSGLFPYLSIAELAVLAYVTLKMMWLKFMLVWRFFRLWAMADGTLAPENMLRCMSNNYSLEKFWRGWHSSFNKWIIRYMYKPMGGRSNRIWSVWPIFLFVAIWHDIEMKLFVWGSLNAFFYVFEVFVMQFSKSKTMQDLPAALFQLICILSGASYIIVLVSVNLLGYAIGIGGIQIILEKAMTWEGVKVLIVCYYFLTQAVSFMNWLQLRGYAAPN